MRKKRNIEPWELHLSLIYFEIFFFVFAFDCIRISTQYQEQETWAISTALGKIAEREMKVKIMVKVFEELREFDAQ